MTAAIARLATGSTQSQCCQSTSAPATTTSATSVRAPVVPAKYQAEYQRTAADLGAYARAIDVLRAIGNEAALGKALLAFGRYKAETGALVEGRDMLRDAITMFAKLGLGRPAGDAEKLLATLH